MSDGNFLNTEIPLKSYTTIFIDTICVSWIDMNITVYVKLICTVSHWFDWQEVYLEVPERILVTLQHL